MAEFQDHFSGHASRYAAARPTYPAGLFDWLAGRIDRRELAWDAATGNGQCAAALADRFRSVHATDASAEQIAAAEAIPGVTFAVETAESPSLADDTVDLVTVAQAAHWFELDRFHEAARRCLRPGGVLAMWCYELCRIDPDVDAVVEEYYRSLDDYWPPARALVEDRYRSLAFPFDEIEAPAFEMTCAWTVDDFLAYLGTWSATRRCAEATGVDPLSSIAEPLRDRWGDGERAIRWPLAMRVGRNGRAGD